MRFSSRQFPSAHDHLHHRFTRHAQPGRPEGQQDAACPLRYRTGGGTARNRCSDCPVRGVSAGARSVCGQGIGPLWRSLAHGIWLDRPVARPRRATAFSWSANPLSVTDSHRLCVDFLPRIVAQPGGIARRCRDTHAQFRNIQPGRGGFRSYRAAADRFCGGESGPSGDLCVSRDHRSCARGDFAALAGRLACPSAQGAAGAGPERDGSARKRCATPHPDHQRHDPDRDRAVHLLCADLRPLDRALGTADRHHPWHAGRRCLRGALVDAGSRQAFQRRENPYRVPVRGCTDLSAVPAVSRRDGPRRHFIRTGTWPRLRPAAVHCPHLQLLAAGARR